jgi:electron transfer flavoprotein alpha subunit
MDAGLLVFVDLSAGELDEVGKGILAEGQRLAAMLNTRCAAVCFAGAPDAAFAGFAPYGVAEVLELRGPAELLDLPLSQAEALAEAARAAGARLVLLAHTDLASQLAPALAASLSAALFTEGVSSTHDWAGLTVRRQVLGTQVVDQRIWTDAPGSPSLVLTLAPRVLSAVVPRGVKRAEVQRTSLEVTPGASAAAHRLTERIPPDPQTVDLTEAQVIFSAGLGCDRDSFELLCQLARAVGASVGVTRPVYDLGWTGFERMVGQTGRTVVPRLYFAFGISGSMHHVGGIKDSRRIVCLNADPKAPIFPTSDEGFVADAGAVLPLLVEKVREVQR